MVKVDQINDDSSGRKKPRGLVIGELLVALLLLAVAVSSLAALMYSVSRPATVEVSQCSDRTGTAAAKCAPAPVVRNAASMLFRAECATPGAVGRDCKDVDLTADSGQTVIRPRTDSASLAMIAKKPNTPRAASRPNLGFIR